MKHPKSRHYYDLSNNLIKEISVCVAGPLAACIDSCLLQGTFPNYEKILKVIPAFKKGDRKNMANFHPISLIPTIEKVFEHMVCKEISDNMDNLGLLCDTQFGVSQGRPTIGPLVSDIFDKFENHAWGMFCDISRLFACVHHGILLQKLNYGIHGAPHGLKKKSYFSLRTHLLVCVGRKWSSVCELSCGARRGLYLVRFFFL